MRAFSYWPRLPSSVRCSRGVSWLSTVSRGGQASFAYPSTAPAFLSRRLSRVTAGSSYQDVHTGFASGSDGRRRHIFPGGRVAFPESASYGCPERGGSADARPRIWPGALSADTFAIFHSVRRLGGGWIPRSARRVSTTAAGRGRRFPIVASVRWHRAPRVGASTAPDPLLSSRGRGEGDRVSGIPCHPGSGAPPPAVREGKWESATEWFGTTALESLPLPPSRLQYPWRRHARKGVRIEKILTRTWLRPDLAHVRMIHSAGTDFRRARR